jgi:hypothetical protein
MPYCKKCGRKIKLGYSLCYDCHERQKRATGLKFDNRDIKIFKFGILWVIPIILLALLFPMVFDARIGKDSSYYTLLLISILWLVGSLYLKKRTGKWIYF